MDSLINHYTANKKVRNDDAYSPGGRIGLRPDRATLPYCQRAREAFPGVPVIAGGVEASLRRLAHYDYWSDTVRRSILLDCKADLVVYGMGEETIVEIAQRLAAGQDGQGPARPARRGVRARARRSRTELQSRRTASRRTASRRSIVIPSFEAGRDRQARLRRGDAPHPHRTPTRTTPRRWSSSTTARPSSQTPPALPLSRSGDGRDLRPAVHAPAAPDRTPSRSPRYEMIKDSVTIMRGCFGGCTFCSITAHQGRIIQSRSQESVLGEVAARWRPTRSSRASSATSAGRRRTCTRCAARGPRSRRSASGCRACTRRSASCSAPTTARSSS